MTNITAARVLALADELAEYRPEDTVAVGMMDRAADTITALAAEVERLSSLAQSYAKRNPWIERAEKAEAALASAVEVTDERVDAGVIAYRRKRAEHGHMNQVVHRECIRASVAAALSTPTEGKK